MKKILLSLVAALVALAASAQSLYKAPGFDDNWSLGVEVGSMTRLAKHLPFLKDMRASFGLHVQKQISPVFALGVEGVMGINTSSWIKNSEAVKALGYDLSGNSTTAIDNMYVGVYGAVNLYNLFGGYYGKNRPFDIELMAGAGWGHEDAMDENYFATRAGVNFNVNCTKNFTLSFKPGVTFNMTGTRYAPLDVENTSAAYDRAKARFNFLVGFTYNFGPGFPRASRDGGEVAALNERINQLRGEIDECLAATAAAKKQGDALFGELEACRYRQPKVVEKVNDNLQSVRYVFYRIGSSQITADQQPNVEMIASYLKNHPEAKVVIKGYASPDGPKELNEKLAAARAESVKNMLTDKFGIDSGRIEACGEGIGSMFSENDWNRVAICTLEK